MAIFKWKSKEELVHEEKDRSYKNKKQELSAQCQEDILYGFKTELRGNIYRFSYDREAQANLQERWQLFQNNMVEQMTLTAHTEDDKDVRITVNGEEFEHIYLTSVIHKENNISILRDILYPKLEEAETIEEIEAITWELGKEHLTGDCIELSEDNTLDKEINQLKSDSQEATVELRDTIDIMLGQDIEELTD